MGSAGSSTGTTPSTSGAAQAQTQQLDTTPAFNPADEPPRGAHLLHPHYHVGHFATAGISGYKPAQIRQAYNLNALGSTGAGQTIAIVDAFGSPTILADANVFSKQFGLPALVSGTNFKIRTPGGKPGVNAGWGLETSLDVEWAHAVAPNATIILEECHSSSDTDLMAGVDDAVAQGASVVSMSFGGPEGTFDLNLDSHFLGKNNVTFTASSGDSGFGVEWPAASPGVVGVGGTSLTLDANNNITSETAWKGSGGGLSQVESAPLFQTANFSADPIVSPSGGRGVPDVSYDGDPKTGFAMYDSTRYQGLKGWWQIGGTSCGAPQWAAIFACINAARVANSKPLLNSTANTVQSQTNADLYNAAYGLILPPIGYNDITQGNDNNSQGGNSALTGYDLVTGLGSPKSAGLGTTMNSAPF
jgi:subtilase family serine protease